MPRLTPQRRQDRREQIADAALRCFSRNGFAATTMADIITESGLSAGSIYSHFEGKVELVRLVSATLLRTGMHELTGGLAAATGILTPGVLLRHLLKGVAGRRGHIPMLLQIWAEIQRDSGLAAVASDNVSRIHEFLQEALAPWADGQATSAPEAAELASGRADALVALLQGFMLRLIIEPAVDANALADTLGKTLD